MTPKNWTLEGKNQTLGGDGGLKIVKNHRTSLMDDPLGDIHKRRLLRGGGRGSPLKADLLHKPI